MSSSPDHDIVFILSLLAANGHQDLIYPLLPILPSDDFLWDCMKDVLPPYPAGKTMRRRLMYAARRGDLERLQYLLKRGSNPNFTQTNGWTALHHSCEQGSLPCVTSLIDKRAHLNVLTNERLSPLTLACSKGHTGVVSLLLSNGADPDCGRTKDGGTALHWASTHGHLPLVKQLIDAGASVAATRSLSRFTPLMLASSNGHLAVCRELLKHSDVNINACTHPEGVTSLMLASEKGHPDIVRELIQRGAFAGATTRRGDTALSIARHMYQPVGSPAAAVTALLLPLTPPT